MQQGPRQTIHPADFWQGRPVRLADAIQRGWIFRRQEGRNDSVVHETGLRDQIPEKTLAD
jgi:hypothetical protein